MMTVERYQTLLMRDPQVQNQVTLQQLTYIIQNLESIHLGNSYVLSKLHLAKELLCVSNLNTVAELIQDILQIKDGTGEISAKHQSIIKEAQELSNLIYQRLAEGAFENANRMAQQGRK